MTIKEANITLMVKDMDQSISFYQSIGLTLNTRWGHHYAQLSAPGVVIGLHPTSEEHLSGGSGNVSIGFTTEHFDQVAEELKGLSIETSSRDEEGGRFLHFSDPDGTALYFIQPKW